MPKLNLPFQCDKILKSSHQIRIFERNWKSNYENSLPPHEFLAAHLESSGMNASKWGQLIGIDRSTACLEREGKTIRKWFTNKTAANAEAKQAGQLPGCGRLASW
ncbi:MAG: hypothetical protein IZT59_12800 [Verrucomicrobia bacterium]|jgi:hypothetical protein|nr:hypothetical protein [Verrucomicrobiota bacterium]|tara:strand:+ start:49344 stop:49658 length:315 start_codon:yes stop_codon:yes gene_type:complete